jgi:quinoprotein glucose dehydrogenase
MPGFVSRLAFGVVFAAASAAVHTADGAPGATDWPGTNYDQSANRYSPLTQITARNVNTLQQVWSFHLAGRLYGRMREDEAIPIVIGNTMYLASPYGAVIALDATTGAEKWRFPLPDGVLPSKRGLAYWPGGGDLRLPASIVFGTMSGGMYSIKASDGTLNEWFGANSVVNLKTHRQVMQTGPSAGYSLLSSPTIYKNLIITSASTGEGPGARMPGPDPPASTRALGRSGPAGWLDLPYRAASGRVRGRHLGRRQRQAALRRQRLGLYVARRRARHPHMPLGAPNNDRVGIDRPGNNLFSSSVVAVDANTGGISGLPGHHDQDYDTQSAPLLADLPPTPDRARPSSSSARPDCCSRSTRHRQAIRHRGAAGAEERRARRAGVADAAVPVAEPLTQNAIAATISTRASRGIRLIASTWSTTTT